MICCKFLLGRTLKVTEGGGVILSDESVPVVAGFIVNEETIGLSIRSGRFALGPG